MSDTFTYEDIAGMIDHALLSPSLDEKQLEEGIGLALAYEVASVCIMPYYLSRCVERLAGGGVRPSTTIGFPHGGGATAVKIAEASRAVADGAAELDMVINISRTLSDDWDYVRAEIQAVTDVAHSAGRKVKVIFENCYLDNARKIRLCDICGQVGVDWVKTSTGYGGGGATDEDLILMRKHSPESVEVKAAGGIRTLDRALEVRAIGCTRIGASATATILDEVRLRLSLPPTVSNDSL